MSFNSIIIQTLLAQGKNPLQRMTIESCQTLHLRNNTSENSFDQTIYHLWRIPNGHWSLQAPLVSNKAWEIHRWRAARVYDVIISAVDVKLRAVLVKNRRHFYPPRKGTPAGMLDSFRNRDLPVYPVDNFTMAWVSINLYFCVRIFRKKPDFFNILCLFN